MYIVNPSPAEYRLSLAALTSVDCRFVCRAGASSPSPSLSLLTPVTGVLGPPVSTTATHSFTHSPPHSPPREHMVFEMPPLSLSWLSFQQSRGVLELISSCVVCDRENGKKAKKQTAKCAASPNECTYPGTFLSSVPPLVDFILKDHFVSSHSEDGGPSICGWLELSRSTRVMQTHTR